MNSLADRQTHFDDVATAFTRTCVMVRILLLPVHQRHIELFSRLLVEASCELRAAVDGWRMVYCKRARLSTRRGRLSASWTRRDSISAQMHFFPGACMSLLLLHTLLPRILHTTSLHGLIPARAGEGGSLLWRPMIQDVECSISRLSVDKTCHDASSPRRTFCPALEARRPDGQPRGAFDNSTICVQTQRLVDRSF